MNFVINDNLSNLVPYFTDDLFPTKSEPPSVKVKVLEKKAEPAVSRLFADESEDEEDIFALTLKSKIEPPQIASTVPVVVSNGSKGKLEVDLLSSDEEPQMTSRAKLSQKLEGIFQAKANKLSPKSDSLVKDVPKASPTKSVGLFSSDEDDGKIP